MKSQKKEITWNIINSLLAGLLVFLGALIDGNVTFNGIITAICAAGIVAISQFKNYWKMEKKEYSNKKKLGSFIP